MSLFVVFTLGYAIGGVSALVLLGLTIAARRGEHMRHGARGYDARIYRS